MGMGPMTGRAAGYCAGYGMPGFMNRGPGGGFGGGGRGRGRGWRNWFYATGVPGWQRAGWGWPAFGFGWRAGGPAAPTVVGPTMAPEKELDMLRQQAEGFAGALEEIRQRINELEARGEAK